MVYKGKLTPCHHKGEFRGPERVTPNGRRNNAILSNQNLKSKHERKILYMLADNDLSLGNEWLLDSGSFIYICQNEVSC